MNFTCLGIFGWHVKILKLLRDLAWGLLEKHMEVIPHTGTNLVAFTSTAPTTAKPAQSNYSLCSKIQIKLSL